MLACVKGASLVSIQEVAFQLGPVGFGAREWQGREEWWRQLAPQAVTRPVREIDAGHSRGCGVRESVAGRVVGEVAGD